MEGSVSEVGNVSSPLSPQSLWSSGSMVDWENPQEPASKGRRRASKVTKSKAPKRQLPALACLNCRTKKVKCQLEDGGCKRCIKFKLECFVPTDDERRQPSSKKLIRQLQDTIRDLKSALDRAHESPQVHAMERDPLSPSSSNSSGRPDKVFTPTSMTEQSNNPPSMLARLCGGQWQLNRDAAGQLRCFGPTSSLHVTESVSSSILSWGNFDGARSVSQWQTRIPLDLQRELLDLYWTYQHPVLQVVHKKAFLDGMTSRQTPYFSELLLCCIFACAARMSDRPEVRALVFLPDDAGDDEVPFLATTVTALLEVELRRPGITTVQSLLLLSVIDCARSNDTKGWLYAGDACRLAYDLGLHRDFQYLGTALLSKYDLEVRQRVFWACFVFDRLWGLYLGRPHCIRLHDVTVPRLKSNQADADPDHQMAAEWANLLEIVGRISEMLNGIDWAPAQTMELDAQLEDWHTNLPPFLQYQPGASPTTGLLHMQYFSAIILLHRPAAQFGTAGTNTTSSSEAARNKCVTNACHIAQILQDYQTLHGSASTMSGVALHTIATAATTLIANVAESRGRGGGSGATVSPVESQLTCLKQCMRALGQLEKSYCVTRRVRKIIQLVIQLSNLDLDQQQQQQPPPAAQTFVPAPPPHRRMSSVSGMEMDMQQQPQKSEPMSILMPQSSASDESAVAAALPLEMWDCPEATSPFMMEDFLFPTMTQYDFLPLYESCYNRV